MARSTEDLGAEREATLSKEAEGALDWRLLRVLRCGTVTSLGVDLGARVECLARFDLEEGAILCRVGWW